MTVAETIEWLKTQDQSATVFVVSHKNGTAEAVVFDPDQHAKYSDFMYWNRDNQPGTELLIGVDEE